jgi:hypothetical protein
MTAGDQTYLRFSSSAQGVGSRLSFSEKAQRDQDEIRVCALKELYYEKRTIQIKQESDATRETTVMAHMSTKKL